MDTVLKRQSAIGVSMPWRPQISPQGTLDRQAAAYQYAGIALVVLGSPLLVSCTDAAPRLATCTDAAPQTISGTDGAPRLATCTDSAPPTITWTDAAPRTITIISEGNQWPTR